MSWKALFPRKVADDWAAHKSNTDFQNVNLYSHYSLKLYLASNALPAPPLITMVGGLDIQEVKF